MPLSGGAGCSRGVVARTLRRRAARAGCVLKRPRLYEDVRDLCPRPWHESRRRAGAVWARALVLGLPLWHRRAWRHTKRTKQGPFGSAKRQRSVRSRAPQIRLRNDEQRCCRDQKLLHPILHLLRRSITMRQTVLALAICGHAAALQPARAPRQSLAVRQATRGVRQRVLDGVGVETRESRRHRRDDMRVETRESRRHRRNTMKRRAATPTARRARPSTRRRRSRTPTIRWTRS